MSSEEGKNRTGVSHRPYDEAFKRAAVAQWQSGVPARRVAEGLGITAEILRTWRRQFAGASAAAARETPAMLPAATADSEEMRAEVRRLRAQFQSVTNQRDILKKPSGSSPAQTGAFRHDRGLARDLPGERPVRGSGRVARGLLRLARARSQRAGPGGCRVGRRDQRHFCAQSAHLRRPRVHRALRRAGHVCGRHRVARLMRRQRLAGRVPGRRRPFTTDRDHAQPIAPNHLGRCETPVERPDEVWAADITYVPTGEGWLYVAGVLDLGSRRLVGWAMGENLETSLPLHALKMALQRRQPKEGLLHHSDRGCQYASEAYREHLAAWQVTPSMSGRANCYYNAAMESFWSTLKGELVLRRSFVSRAQAASAIFDYIETFYNRERLHGTLGYLSLLWNLKGKAT